MWTRMLSMVLTATLAVAPPRPAQVPQASVWTGYWDGAILLSRGVSEVDVVVELARDAAGALQGRLWFPTHPSGPYALEKLAAHGRELSFEVRDEEGVVSSFAGAATDGATLAGTFHERQASCPFELRRREGPPAMTLKVGELADDGAELRAALERDTGHVRLVLLVSPQSFQSKITLRVIKRYVLDAIGDPSLRVYVIWEPHLAERARDLTAAAIKPLLTDPRVTELYSRSGAASRLLKELLPPAAEQYSLCMGFAAGGAAPLRAADWIRLAGKRDYASALATDQRCGGPAVAALVRAQLAAAFSSSTAVAQHAEDQR